MIKINYYVNLFGEVSTVLMDQFYYHAPYIIQFHGKFFTIVGWADCSFLFEISSELRGM